MSRRSGFTLIEMVVVTALLLIISGITFMLFTMGTRGYRHAVARTGAVGDLHAFNRLAGRDLTMTHIYSSKSRSRDVSTSRGTARRDGVCMVGLSDWGADSSFQPATGLPKWDRWIIYYATREPEGRLVRLEFERGAPYYPLEPISNLNDWMVEDLNTLPGDTRVTTVCQNVHAFEVETDEYQRLISLHITLYNKAGKRMGSDQQIEELLEARLEVTPMNSYPEL